MIKIWKEETPEKELFLRLTRDEDGDVSLCIVNKDGEKLPAGMVAWIGPGGQLGRNSNIDKAAAKAVGLELDDEGRINLYPNY